MSSTPLMDPLSARYLAAVNYWALQRGKHTMRAASLAMGGPVNHISQVYHGVVRLPGVRFLERIVKEGFDANWLFTGRGPVMRDGCSPGELVPFISYEVPEIDAKGRIRFAPVPRPEWRETLTPTA